MFALLQENAQLASLIATMVAVLLVLSLIEVLAIRYGERVLRRIWHYMEVARFHLLRQPLIQHLVERHPALSGFLAARFQREHFFGLTLTMFVVMGGYVLALYAGLVEDVVEAEAIVAFDHYVSAHMSVLRSSPIISSVIVITSLGAAAVTCLIIALTSIVCAVLRKPYIIVGLLISTIGSTLFSFLSKMLFARERPTEILLTEQTYSFPSGHATISIALYGFIAYIAIRLTSNFAWQVRLFSLAVMICVLVGLSRIVLNEHYLSDVLGGFLAGSLWLIVAISVTEWLTSAGKIHWQHTWRTFDRVLVAACLIIAAIASTLYAYFHYMPMLGSA
ncbi:phosphatase PAP2 family protein [Psychrobacter aestuarii]|uniref:undecaprenyl-diphosphate phosphatase n=1 Tax=Psychrobacter aestuarii TaxID=556327 RepID=A0ABP3FHI8_9GAMM|nr:phosphatase PAP2 family protein [Psychrobacter aestuarii]